MTVLQQLSLFLALFCCFSFSRFRTPVQTQWNTRACTHIFYNSSPPTPSTPLFLQRWWAHLDRPISTKTLNLNCAEKLFPPAITPPALFTPTFNNDTFWPYQPYFPAFSLFCFQFILPRLAGESWRSKKRTDIKPVGLCFSKGAKKSSIKEDV